MSNNNNQAQALSIFSKWIHEDRNARKGRILKSNLTAEEVLRMLHQPTKVRNQAEIDEQFEIMMLVAKVEAGIK